QGTLSNPGLYFSSVGLVIKQRFSGISVQDRIQIAQNVVTIFAVIWLLSTYWMPLGPTISLFKNLLFVSLIFFFVLILFKFFIGFYSRILSWCLSHKWKFLSIPAIVLLF